jgi:copper(I)-binding protein
MLSICRFLRTSATALGLAAAGACALAHEYPTEGFMLIHPWAEATQPGATEAAVYFRLDDVSRDDRLLRATTPYAESVEMRAADDGAVAALPFGPAPQLEFTPGKPHMLLRGLKQPLQWGRSYLMTMVFEKAGPVLVMVSVGAH